MKAIGIIAALVIVAVVAAWFWLRAPDIPYTTLDREYADAASHFVDLPGGYHVHYQDDGDPALPLLVLLHGYGDSFTTWQGWVGELKTRRRIISLDFPGHGLTRAPRGSVLTSETLADFVDQFAAALALPKFSVAGNSMGGGVAWQLALHHPQRVNALVLLDAAGFANEKPPADLPLAFKMLQYPLGRALVRNIDSRFLIRESLRSDVYDKSLITPFLVDRWADLQRGPGHREILMNVNLGGFSSASPAALASIAVPTLIIWGEADTLIEPAAGRKFAAAIPGSKLITYKQVGHLPQLEVPARSAADVLEFLNTIPPSP